MAILNDGINGGFSGKVGSIIGYSLNGKNIIKGLPRLSRKNKKGTAKQNLNRSGFTKMQHFLSPLLYFIRVGFNLDAKAKNMTAHNAAKSYNLLNAFNAEGEIDCAKVCLSNGKLPKPIAAIVANDDVGIHFTWTYDSQEVGANADDQVMLVAYNLIDKRAYFMLSGARRKTGTETLEIPSYEKGKDLHTWISFIADDRESISMSSYVGVLEF